MKSDLKKLCDELEESNKSGVRNPIKHVKEHLKKYVDGDNDVLLTIKIEAEEVVKNQFVVTILEILSLPISAFSLFMNLVGSKSKCYGILILLAVIVLLIAAAREVYVTRNMRKWSKYVIAVIKQMEEERIC